MRTMRRLATDVRGGTAIEYALILALIVLVMIASFILVADKTIALWSNVAARVSEAH